MSFRGPEMHFQDILKAIRLIEQFVGDMDFALYADDIKTRAAVERELQIVTEAAYRLKPEDEVLCAEPDWRRIRGMGNILRHAYDRVDDEAVWNTIKDDLPALKRDVGRALATHFRRDRKQ
jgi:uncharacterized protein with HEPN domain